MRYSIPLQDEHTEEWNIGMDTGTEARRELVSKCPGPPAGEISSSSAVSMVWSWRSKRSWR
jgi:hypothetical protein